MYSYPSNENEARTLMKFAGTAALVRPSALGYAVAMISVLIQTRNDEETLARTLATLVGGSIEGVVREVVVHDLGSTDQTRMVAEHAGCTLVGEAGLADAVNRSRGQWLLVLQPGARLTEGWTEQALLHMGEGARPARFTRSHIGMPGFWTRLFEQTPPFADGLLMAKTQALASLMNGQDLGALGRGTSPVQLPAEIVRAPAQK